MSDLTQKQQEVLSYIEAYRLANGNSPTVREMCDHFGMSSPNGIQCHIKALRKKGRLADVGRKARSVREAEPCPKLIKSAFGQFSVPQLQVYVKTLKELISEKLASS